jgi:integrase
MAREISGAACAAPLLCVVGINRRADGGLELPLKLVQARLGHASIQMTADRYGHLFPRGDDAAELAEAEKAFLV